MKSPKQLFIIVFAVAFITLLGSFVLVSCGGGKETTATHSPTDSDHTKTKSLLAPTDFENAFKSASDAPNGLEAHRLHMSLIVRIAAERRSEAVPLLIDHLVSVPSFSTGSPGDYLASYPCAAALAKIGEPAVPLIQKRLVEAQSDLEQEVLLDVLRSIKGKAFVIEWIKGVLADQTSKNSSTRRPNLERWALARTQ